MIVVFGGDALALRVCEELIERDGKRVVLLWDGDADFARAVQATGARFVARTADEAASLREAGIGEAAAILAIAGDDNDNLQVALAARDLNPAVRVVLRQFNRSLGRKIEQNLSDCSVVSLSSHAAATYASAAVDPTCFFGVQFPDIDGRLVGFFKRSGTEPGLARRSPAQIEAHDAVRVVARGGQTAFDREAPLGDGESVITFGAVVPRFPKAAGRTGSRPRSRAPELVRDLRRADPLLRRLLVAVLLLFAAGTAFFALVLHLDVLTAAYFVVATMTTTGYGDISARSANGPGEAGAIVLMVAGVAFTGILVAVGSSLFTRAQYAALQGLRPVSRRGHVIVCGAGNVGSRVIEFLVRMRCAVVVIEIGPKPEIVEGSRARRFDLLTGDATKDSTLDLCNVAEAASLVALTHSDTMNLEVALSARAREPDLPIAMRVQHESFQTSVRSHFGFENTFGTAALAAPLFVGLATAPGARGRVRIDAHDFRLIECVAGSDADRIPDGIPLCVLRDEEIVLIADTAAAFPSERILMLQPVPPSRRAPSAAALAMEPA